MHTLKILAGSTLVVSVVGGIFMLLVRLMSTEESARMISAKTPIIALVILFLWLTLGWAATGSFGRGLAAGLIEGVLAYAVIRITSSFVVDDYEWARILAEPGDEPSPVDPSTSVVFFMALTAIALLIGFVVLGAPDPSEPSEQDEGTDDDDSGSSAALAASTAIITTTAITSMH